MFIVVLHLSFCFSRVEKNPSCTKLFDADQKWIDKWLVAAMRVATIKTVRDANLTDEVESRQLAVVTIRASFDGLTPLSRVAHRVKKCATCGGVCFISKISMYYLTQTNNGMYFFVVDICKGRETSKRRWVGQNLE